MSRTTIAISTGLIVLGCVVAWLPAQDSSRRAVPKNRLSNPANPAPAEERPSLTPPSGFSGDFPPTTTPPAKLPEAADAGSSRISAGLRSAYPPSQFSAGSGEQSSPATDDLGLNSEAEN